MTMTVSFEVSEKSVVVIVREKTLGTELQRIPLSEGTVDCLLAAISMYRRRTAERRIDNDFQEDVDAIYG